MTNPYVQYAGFTSLYLLSYGLMCMGLGVHARLLGIDSRHRRLLATLIAGGAVLLFLPHAASVNDLAFRIAAIGTYALAGYCLLGSVLANQIRGKVTTAFARPITLIMWYLRLVSGGAFFGVIALFMLGDIQGKTLYIATSAGAPIQAIILYAGYLFKRETGR